MHLASFVVPGLLALGLARAAVAQEQSPPMEQPPMEQAPPPVEETTVTTEEQPLIIQQPTVAPVFGFIGGGPVIPLAEAGDRFNVGPGFNAGIGFNFNPYLGVQLEGFWSRYGVNGDLFNSTDLDADHRMQYGVLDVVANVVRSGPFTAYLLAGGGLYYRRVQLTQFAGTAVVPACDPWLYYCYPSAVSVETILGTRSSTDWGLNGGVGFSVRVASGLRVYAEGRYHYIFGPEIINSSDKANGEYIPVMFGLRFE
jgi:opacity protein-like surface antigen